MFELSYPGGTAVRLPFASVGPSVLILYASEMQIQVKTSIIRARVVAVDVSFVASTPVYTLSTHTRVLSSA
jgi:hypothetical protein